MSLVSESAKPPSAEEDGAAALLDIARDLAEELHPERQARRIGLDASLDRDWGFDSLSRAELLLRAERRFQVSLPEKLLGEAQTLSDVLRALALAKGRVPAAVEPAFALVGAEAGDLVPREASTLTAALDWHVERHGERCHVVIVEQEDSETRLSYRDLAERARRAAAGLRRAGVRPGERVAMMMPTGAAFLEAFLGLLYAGAVPAPIYPPTSPAQIGEHLQRQAGILRNARAGMLIAGAEARPLSQLLRLQVETLRQIVTVEELAGGDDEALPKIGPQDVALQQYTSGSTGDPKGVVLSHANVLANIRAMGEAMAVRQTDVFVSWLPLFHDLGLIGVWLGSLYYGVPLVVMSPWRFLLRPERWLWAVHRYRGTLSAAPNFAFELCLRKIDDGAIAGIDLSSLRFVANGSEPVSADTLRRFFARFGRYGFRSEAMAPAYGLAESGTGLTLPPLGRAPVIDRIERQALQRQGRAIPATAGRADVLELVACGHPLAGHEIRILGPTGELGERQEGRLQFRGPSATSGYFENPEKNRELFDGDWLNTGDLAYIAGGDLFITGRSKDIIIRAGQHIHPQEIEDLVGGLEGVRSGGVVVLGIADPRAGTERLVVVAETAETDPARRALLQRQIVAAAARSLDAPPEEVVLVPPYAVPKTANGKIRRAAARDLYVQNTLGASRGTVWRQLAGFALAGVLPQLRRLERIFGEWAYAAYWWTMVAILGVVAWPLVVLLPKCSAWAAFHVFARAALRLLRVEVSVKGIEAFPAHAVVVANHASYIDGLVLAAVLPGELAFVAKRELAGQAVAGPFLRALGTLFVERGDPEGGVEDLHTALASAQAGRRLIFFPEGTFTRAPGLLPFRLGAFSIAARLRLSIVPVVLSGTRSILRGDQWMPRRGSATVEVCDAIRPEAEDFAAVVRLRDAARAAILARCGEPEMLGT